MSDVLKGDADAVLASLKPTAAHLKPGPGQGSSERDQISVFAPAPVRPPARRLGLPMRDSLVGTSDVTLGEVTVRVRRFAAEAPGLRRQITAGATTAIPIEWYILDTLARDLRRLARIDKLLGIEAVRGKLTPHIFQMDTALRVLRDGRHASILADEVGLGKTIEAGLILKELILRGDARRILIVVPKALVGQWQRELRDKFGEEFATTEDERDAHLTSDRVITTLGKFQRSVDDFVKHEWDVVLFDEAHLLANPKSKRREAAAELPRRWMLLSTATPLSNWLSDLWSLVDLVSPGRIGTVNQFLATYAADKTNRKVHPHLADELRMIARESMHRTRRSESGVPFSARFVETRKVPAGADEDQLYDNVTSYLTRTYRRQGSGASNRGMLIREAISLQQSLSSGPQALALALEHRAATRPTDRGELTAMADAARGIRGCKEQLLSRVLREVPDEPAVIFTLRKETLHRLVNILSDEGHDTRPYHGEMSGAQRTAAVEAFTKGTARFLVATDAGAEGLNLHQRCNIIVNYDLHWNPMKLEQRIGRVHRFGQERAVTVFNLAVQDTVDDYVLEVLTQKLNLFTSVIGELEDVLAEIEEGEGDLETLIMELVLRAKDRIDLKGKLAELGSQVEMARQRALLAAEFTSGVLG